MKSFLCENFLLSSPIAQELYHETAAKAHIIDYHCHLNPLDILENKQYQNIAELWLGADHYKWRLMRAAGVPEAHITGALPRDPFGVFSRYAAALEGAIGHPLYHWTHLELQRYFHIHEPLTPKSAKDIYEECNRQLASETMRTRGILQQSKVDLLCTTDDPADDLAAHKALQADKTLSTRVLPCFRPDKAMNIAAHGFADYVRHLGQTVGGQIDCFSDLKDALCGRAELFHSHGCRASDHGFTHGFYSTVSDKEAESIFQKGLKNEYISPAEIEQYITALFLPLCRKYNELGWVTQVHFGCTRNLDQKRFRTLGADTGFDAINADSRPLQFAPMLDALVTADALPRMIFYSLNPHDNAAIAVMLGCFLGDADCPGKLQLGSAWWFNDNQNGMRTQLTTVAEQGRLHDFVGMLTDSRSIVSYPRHEYFRRILCELIGNWVENGEYPHHMEYLHTMVDNICYHNAMGLFQF